jgi:hypothetical protein
MNDHATHDATTTVPPGTDDSHRDFDGLDPEHLERVFRVGRCETADGQRYEAMKETARADGESATLRATGRALGSKEHLDAIRKSEWFSHARAIKVGARFAWIVDSGLWLALTLSAALAMLPALGSSSRFSLIVAGIAAALAAVLFAKGSRGFGRYFALAFLTHPFSVVRTIDRQVRLGAPLGVIALLAVFAIVALYFLASGDFASWAPSLGGWITLAANVLLGLSAGILLSASDLLEKVPQADAIHRLLEMKAWTKLYLGRFLLVVAVLVQPFVASVAPPCGAAETLQPPVYTAATRVAAGPVLIVALDITDSSDSTQRELAIDALVDSALFRARELGAKWILVVPFSDQELLSDMKAVKVPILPADITCDAVFASVRFTKSWIALSPGALAKAKAEAVAACEERRRAASQSVEANERAFADALRRAMLVTPRDNVTTRIVPLVQAMVDRPYVRAVDVVTDLCDHSGIPVESLQLRPEVPVNVIVTRPNPKRPQCRLSEVLRAAERWREMPGIRVTTAAEYAILVRAAQED